MANPVWTDPEDWEDVCPNCGGQGFVVFEYDMRTERCEVCRPRKLNVEDVPELETKVRPK